MRARLGGYAMWQLRDFAFERAAAIIVVFGLLIWAMYVDTAAARASVFVVSGSHAIEFGAVVMAGLISQSWFLTALVAVYGISANDRTTGRFRLLFAKPAPVLRFYGQAFALHFGAFLLCAALAVAAFTRLFPASGATVSAALVLYVVSFTLVGGVCFLFSAIWRYDWLSTGTVFGVVMYLASRFPGAKWLDPLPPFWRISQQIESLKAMDPLQPKPLLWVAAYGVACFLLGLIILKRRPLAT